MKTLYYTTTIEASPIKVHEAMLDKTIYQEWTKAFSPTSNYRGTWEEGTKVHFLSTDDNGDEMGLISRIDKNIPGEIVIVRHIGILSKDGEQYEGEEVEPWKNFLEVYRFKSIDGLTQLVCSLEVNTEEDELMFDKIWAKALEDLKRICES